MANQEKNNRIAPAIRKEVYRRDKYICQLCGCKVILTRNIKNKDDYKKEASIDHIIPNKSNDINNLQTACRSCNSRKKDKSYKELQFLNLNNGNFTRIHNVLLLALARTKLTSQESRILFAVIHKTYGYQKSQDWISNSQLEELTGIHRSHCANTVTRLKSRNVVTKTGNKIRFNKYFFEWRELPKQVTKGVMLPKQAQGVTQTGNQVLPKQVHTKEYSTKEKQQKKKGRPNCSKEETKRIKKLIDGIVIKTGGKK